MHEMVGEFNRAHPDILVKDRAVKSTERFFNNYNILIRQLLCSLAIKSLHGIPPLCPPQDIMDPPDVSQVYENWTTQLIESNSLVPMQKFFSGPESFTGKDVADLVPSFRQSNTYRGKIWTLPFNKSIYVLYYNKKHFQEARLTPPRTWDEFSKAAKKLTLRNSAREITRYGFVFQPSVDIFGILLYSRGGDYIKGKQVTFHGKEGIESLQYLTDLVGKHQAATPSYDAAKDFQEGKASMYIETTSKRVGLDRSAQLSYGIAPLPAGKKEVCLFAGTNLAIFSHSSPEVQKAAWTFVRWLITPENTTRWAEKTGYVPVRSSAIASKSYRQYLARDPRGKVAVETVRKARMDPRIGAWETMRGLVSDAVYKAVKERSHSPKSLLVETAAQCQRLILNTAIP
ncbi:MAG: ABC transporter substrate-binding protein [Armatimonadetes bacterium]|nr:ABC transporter substrate-binding protein [Armatimonadota bacterium]